MVSRDPILFNGYYFISQLGTQYTVHQRTGRAVSDKSFERVQSLSGQYLAVKKFGYWAILDGIQGILSDFRYDSVGAAKGFSAVVKYVGKWGVHHPDMQWIIPPDFDRITYTNDHYIAEKGRSFHLFDENGEPIFQTIDEIVPTAGFFMLKYENKVSALGANGRPVANTEYNSVAKWGDYFELNRGDTAELYSLAGKQILSFRDQVQDVMGYSEGLILIKRSDKYGFIDENRKLRIANRYDAAQPFSEGMAAVMIRGKWGFIDLSEKLAIQPYYDQVSAFINGLAIVQLGDKQAVIDRDGREIIEAEYANIHRNEQGNFILRHSQGAYGFADASGTLRLSALFDSLEDLGNNTIRIEQNGKYGLYDYTGRNKIPLRYSELRVYGETVYMKEDSQ